MEYTRTWQGVDHLIKGFKKDKFECTHCKVKFNQANFHVASAYVDRETQKVYKRLKRYCKNCENPLRAIRNALEKHPDTPPKTDYCEHCKRENCKIVLHHNHKTGKFVRWSCVNCNSRFTNDTLEQYIEEGKRWYNELS